MLDENIYSLIFLFLQKVQGSAYATVYDMIDCQTPVVMNALIDQVNISAFFSKNGNILCKLILSRSKKYLLLIADSKFVFLLFNSCIRNSECCFYFKLEIQFFLVDYFFCVLFCLSIDSVLVKLY